MTTEIRRFSQWQHKKSGKDCYIVCTAFIEATEEPAVVYTDAKIINGVILEVFDTWIRPRQEFLERFILIG